MRESNRSRADRARVRYAAMTPDAHKQLLAALRKKRETMRPILAAKEIERRANFTPEQKAHVHVLAAQSRKRRQEHILDVNRKRKYGISKDRLLEIIKAQGGVCPICKRPLEGRSETHVDHDHETNRVRGALCGRCNRALGLLADDPTRLLEAVVYLFWTAPVSVSPFHVKGLSKLIRLIAASVDSLQEHAGAATITVNSRTPEEISAAVVAAVRPIILARLKEFREQRAGVPS
jgi:uncharacterized protein YbaR (Trm112 family)